MQQTKPTGKKNPLSIIIPTYNGEVWLPKTLDEIMVAVKAAAIKTYEVIVINDGSTDNTEQVVEQYALAHKLKIRIISQVNSGRFVARKRGAEEAKYDLLLFVDTRVFIGKNSLKYVLKAQAKDPSRKVWCSHVRVDTAGNIYARFWEAIAFAAWRKYFRNPRDISYGIEKFDDYPKGTTCFITDRALFVEANKWFVKNTMDLKTSNDDTLLLRHIAQNNSINISPDFWCLYHARTSMKQYMKHAHHRGKVFVDGFLRNDGNRFFVPLILFLAVSALMPIAIAVLLVLNPLLLVYALCLGVVLWILELLLLLVIRVPWKDAVSLFVLSPVFATVYGAGIWQAFIRTRTMSRRTGH